MVRPDAGRGSRGTGRRRGLRARRGDGAIAGGGAARRSSSSTATQSAAPRSPRRSAPQFVEADVTDADSVSAAVERAAAVEGGLRISVCCAGIGWAERVSHKAGPHNLEYFSNVIGVNLIGTFNVLRLASTAMSGNEPDEAGERGVCVNTASIAAFDGQIGQIAYAASKGGIVSMTLPAARDLAGRGIRVMTIAPGLFDTPLLAALPEEARAALGAGIPYPSRLGRPEEYAQLVEQIVANQMLNGETIRLDGALRMPPK